MPQKQIFEGIRVADFSWVAVGPEVGRELAEHGATVIRIESHKHPDTLRVAPPFRDGIPGIDRSAFGAAYNTQKYGISLDINTPKGKEVARRLVKWADIVADSMTPGTMEKWGLDYESLKKIKPDIIMFRSTQQGQFGPYAKFGGYGQFAAIMGGFSHITGWPDRSPVSMFNNYTDFVCPWSLIIAVIGALLYRRKTGQGLCIEQAQIEGGISLLGPAILDYRVNGRIAGPKGNRDPYMAPHSAYPCLGDDKWVAISVGSDEEWQAFCKVLGEPEWTSDSRFATFQSRQENEEELDRLVGEWSKDYPPEEVMALMQCAGIAAGVVATSQDLFNDPQLKHRQHFRMLNHKVIGPHVYHAPAYILSKAPAHIYRAAPCLGEHNEYVYKEILGYSDDEVADMLATGVITTETDVPDIIKSR